MEVQRYPVSNEARYFLDCACEYEEVDSTTYFTMLLYAPRDQIDEIVNRPPSEGLFSSLAERRAMCDDLARLATRILRQLPHDRAGKLIHTGLSEVPLRIKTIAEHMASWALTDATRGGCEISVRPIWRENRKGAPTAKVIRQIVSPRWVKRYVRKNSTAIELKRILPFVLDRAGIVPSGYIVDGLEEIQKDCMDQKERARAAMLDAFDLNLHEAALLRKARQPEPKHKRRKRHKTIKRAAMLAAGLLGAATVSAFARGEDVVLPGIEADLSVRLTRSCSSLGHGAVSTDLLTKDGKHLSGLCVYFDNTPALDQLVAFKLHLDAGLEKELIESANLFAVGEEARDNPLVAERVRNRPDYDYINPVLRSEFEDNRRERFFEEHGDVWIRSIAVFALGVKAANALSL